MITVGRDKAKLVSFSFKVECGAEAEGHRVH